LEIFPVVQDLLAEEVSTEFQARHRGLRALLRGLPHLRRAPRRTHLPQREEPTRPARALLLRRRRPLWHQVLPKVRWPLLLFQGSLNVKLNATSQLVGMQTHLPQREKPTRPARALLLRRRRPLRHQVLPKARWPLLLLQGSLNVKFPPFSEEVLRSRSQPRVNGSTLLSLCPVGLLPVLPKGSQSRQGPTLSLRVRLRVALPYCRL
jgi:hypothetical protein